MNILVNIKCNAHCSYCFAGGKCCSRTNISLQDYCRALKFAVVSKDNQIKILGGEPTLHPKFIQIISETMHFYQPQEIQIFTNGFVNSNIVDFLKNKKLNYILNFTARNFINEEKSKLSYFLQIVGPQTMLGINYFGKLTDAETLEIFQTIKKFKLRKTIRLGISAPTYNLSNLSFNFNRSRKILNEDLVLLSKKCLQEGISIFMDCSCVPLCAIDDKTITYLKKYARTDLKVLCEGPIDLLPDNNVIRCFACSSVRYPLRSFRNKQEIRDLFKKMDSFLLQYAGEEKCQNCQFYCKTCQGGCMAYKIARLEKLDRKKRIFFEKKFILRK